MWTKLFLQEQGYNPTIVLQQDNTSAIKLEKNGKSSSGQRTRHLNIRFFYIKDLLDKKEFDVEYCSTEAMQADFLSKPLQGELFEKQMKWLMGIEWSSSLSLVRVTCEKWTVSVMKGAIEKVILQALIDQQKCVEDRPTDQLNGRSVH